jgi:zinc protease
MTDILMNPVFAQQELARAQQQAISGITANMEDPDFIADAALQRALYGQHPYGHLENGTLASIPEIQRDDLIRFHQSYYAPNISALAIVGDLVPSEAFNLAERWFGSWTKKDVPRPGAHDVPTVEGRKVLVIDKPDAVQTEIRVGQITVPRKDRDYFNVLVASYVLGGTGSGRLNQALRVERGLTYGAYATIQPRKGPGSFYSTTDTRTEKTLEALNLLFAEIQEFRSGEVPADELQNAKSFLIGSFPLSIEIPDDLARRLTTVFLYELGDDYLKTYRDRLAGVSASDVLRIAKEKISVDNVVIVLVGKADEFKTQLDALGKSEIIPIRQINWDSPALR